MLIQTFHPPAELASADTFSILQVISELWDYVTAAFGNVSGFSCCDCVFSDPVISVLCIAAATTTRYLKKVSYLKAS